MKKYAVAGAFVVSGVVFYLSQISTETVVLAPEVREGSPEPLQPSHEQLGSPNDDAIIRQEAKLLAGPALYEAAESPATEGTTPDIDAEAIPLTSQKQPLHLGDDLDADALFVRTDRAPKALGPDLDPEAPGSVVSRPPQRLGEDIDVEAYELMTSEREPQSLGDDIDVGDQSGQQ